MILNGPISEVKRSGEVFKELRKAAAAEMVISREVWNGGNHVKKRDGNFKKYLPYRGINISHHWKRKIIFKRAIGMRYVFSEGISTLVL